MSERTRTSSGERTHTKPIMYLIDTNVISEARKRAKANRGVRQFFRRVIKERTPVFLSLITVGGVRRGILALRPRGVRHHGGGVGEWGEAQLWGDLAFFFDIYLETPQPCGRPRGTPPDNHFSV